MGLIFLHQWLLADRDRADMNCPRYEDAADESG
jgi:hypothetical protein